MKRPLALSLAVFFLVSAHASEIQVGSTRLSIPAPAGCSLVAADLPCARLIERTVPAVNQQLALFLPDADAAVAAKGEVPDLVRGFQVQILKKDIHALVPTAEFEATKRLMKDEHQALAKELGQKLPGFLDHVSQGFSKDFDVDVALSVSQVLPLPPHHESDRSFAFSMILRVGVARKDVQPDVSDIAVTTTLVHVRGKILFLYVSGEKSDLDWTRQACAGWAAAVIAANTRMGGGADLARGDGSGGAWIALGLGAAAIVVVGIVLARRRARSRSLGA